MNDSRQYESSYKDDTGLLGYRTEWFAHLCTGWWGVGSREVGRRVRWWGVGLREVGRRVQWWWEVGRR